MPENKNASGDVTSGRFNASGRIAIYIVASTTLVFLLTLAIVATISLRAQWDSFYSYSNQLCLSSNAQAAYVIDGDMVERFAKSLRIDPEYEAFSAYLDELGRTINAKYFYVLVDAGVPGMYTYIYDANHDEDYPGHKYALGDNESKEQYVGAAAVLATGLGFQQAMYYNDPENYGELYYAYSPIFNTTGEVVAFLGTDIDISPTKEKLHTFQRNLLLTVVFAVVAFILIYYLVIKRIILDPLENVTDAALNLSRGKVELLQLTQLTSRNDEIGQLGAAFESVSGSIKGLISDIGRLMRAIRGGRLNMRVEPDAYEGDYHQIITGVNMTLDVMCQHFDTMEKGVCFFDYSGETTLYCNQVAERYFGLHNLPEEGRSLLSSLLGLREEQELSELLQDSAEMPCYRTLNLTDAGSGVHRAYSLSLNLIRNDYSDETAEVDNSCVLALITDITSIARARMAAEQANQAKTEFLSRVSHEMRTPMNAIIGMTYIAGSTDEKDKIRYCLDKIDTASKQLLTVIDDMLDMSRIESHQLKVFNKEFNFRNTLENITGPIQYEAEKKKQNFLLRLDPNIPATVIGDNLRLSQVLTKLLTNAIKFTDENGTITMSIEKAGEEDNLLNLQFEIIDTGIGISPEQLPRLFAFFEQGDGGIDRKYGGTGLGLVISKYIIELMGGQIQVASELGYGTRFSFNIKVEKGQDKPSPEQAGDHYNLSAAAAKEHAHNTFRFQNHTILLAEDKDVDRDIFLTILEPTGLSIDFARSGQETVGLFDDKPERYDLILMSIQMPGISGYEATRQIRSLEHPEAVGVPIIALTPNQFWEDANRYFEIGVNDQLSKPIDPRNLLLLLEKYLSRTNPEKPPEPKVATVTTAKNAAGFTRNGDDYSAINSVIDVQDGLNRLMNNKKLYFMSLEKFAENALAEEIAASIGENDLPKVTQGARALKDIAANLGLTNLHSVAANVENHAKSEVNPVNLLDSLMASVALTKDTIKRLLESEE